MKFKYLISLGLVISVTSSCEKTLDVKVPSGQYISSTLFATADGAQTAMRGIYESMTTGGFSGKTNPWAGSFTGMLGLASDELIRNSYDANQTQFFDNKVLQENSANAGIWASTYNYIFQANFLFEHVERSTGISETVKNELMGEAMFIRAISHFYLTNLYRDIPLALKSEYTVNALLPRTSQEKIYEQVIIDLKYAINKMSATKFVASGTRLRANKWAALAFLSKVYLYKKDWVNAEALASEVIAQTASYKLEPLENVFLSTSMEAIWQLANPGANLYNVEAGLIGGQAATNTAYRLSPYTVSLFSNGDQRLTKWTRLGTGTGANTRAPSKYKTFSNTQAGAKKECLTPIRLAELYLIRAEARAMQDKLADAIKDIDEVRKRAGAVIDDNPVNGNDKIVFKTIGYANPTIDKTGFITLVYEERLREFFAENGQRWFDARRSGKTLAEFFGPRKVNIENDGDLPIPLNDINNNPNL